jgi:uncharacterized protein YwgA
MSPYNPHLVAARIIQDAGGELIGRTRLQKVTYLSQLAGFGDEFSFEYHHYGPYSEDLALGMEIAAELGPVTEEEKQAEWGGRYSIYKLRNPLPPANPLRAAFLRQAKAIDANELELAATAAYLFAVDGIGRTKDGNPWEETRKRKPQKAGDGRLERAARAYDRLRKVPVPRDLPELPILRP